MPPQTGPSARGQPFAIPAPADRVHVASHERINPSIPHACRRSGPDHGYLTETGCQEQAPPRQADVFQPPESLKH
eukprot:761423-Prymnesium_polylepis.1